jgi:hypothetical protein
MTEKAPAVEQSNCCSSSQAMSHEAFNMPRKWWFSWDVPECNRFRVLSNVVQWWRDVARVRGDRVAASKIYALPKYMHRSCVRVTQVIVKHQLLRHLVVVVVGDVRESPLQRLGSEGTDAFFTVLEVDMHGVQVPAQALVLTLLNSATAVTCKP